MADIFVSYASEDRERIRPLVAALEARGWSVWWDRELVAGPNFDSKIEEALDAAGCVVVVWSQHSIQSEWVRTEANEGRERQVLVPVLIDDVKPPLAFRIAQSARLVGWPNQQGELNTLTAGITALLGAASNDPALTPAPQKSIAVLPFVNMSNDPEQEFFSDGMSEEIINALVGVPKLKVIARTSSFQFKGSNQDIRDIGKRLDVNHILEGSVRKAGNRIRVTAQLIKTDDAAHLWSERFDRELTDVFAVQDEITEQIVKALRGTLIGVELAPSSPVDMDAYNAYLMGGQYFSQMRAEEAIVCYKQAINIEPDYADALSALARAYSHDWVMTGERPGELDTCLDRAERIAPGNRVLGTCRVRDLFFVEFRYQQALDRLATLLTRFPNDSDLLTTYGIFCMHLGRPDLGVSAGEQAVRTDPLWSLARAMYAETLLRSGRPDEAEAVLKQAAVLSSGEIYVLASIAATRSDMTSLARCVDMSEEGSPLNICIRAFYLKTVSDEKGLDTLFATHKETDVTVRLYLSALRGDVDDTLDTLKHGLETGAVLAYRFNRPLPHEAKLFAAVYSDPRYQELLKSYGLDKESLANIRFPELTF